MFEAVGNFVAWAPLGVPAFLFVVTLVVFVHELGHFLAARACGVRVETFSIGFGPEIFGWNDRHGTRWKIAWVPFGGYVKFFGDQNAASTPDREAIAGLTAEEQKVAFPFKPLWQRAFVVAAGPAANFVLAVAIFTMTFMLLGREIIAPRVDAVIPNSAAEAAGIKTGDVVRSIDGKEIAGFNDMLHIVTLSGGRTLEMTVDRGGKSVLLHVAPRQVRAKNQFGDIETAYRLGIKNYLGRGEVTRIHYGPIGAFEEACGQTWLIVTSTLTYVGQMITGTSDASQLRGPVGMAEVSRKVAVLGVMALVQLVALVSVSIGLINLFPIPLLDGGHLLYYGYEAVRGRPLGVRAQDMGFRLGLAVVVGLMILATWNDLSRFSF